MPQGAQLFVQVRSVPLAHAHIQQQELGHIERRGDLERGLRAIGQFHHTPPALQQRTGGGADTRVVVDAPDPAVAQRAVIAAIDHRGDRRRRGGQHVRCRPQRQAYREHAAAPQGGTQPDRMAEQTADPLHDRQTQPGPAFLVHAVIQPAEFFEDLALQALRYTGALVVHFDAQLTAIAAAAEQHAPARGVAQRVGEEVLQDAAQQRFIAHHHRTRIHPVQLQAAAVGSQSELAGQRFQQR
ncbi:hypothetical protein D3C71_1403110 [compost metagenome]